MALNVTHIITALTPGGAEGALYNLLAHLPPGRINARVICLMGEDFYAERIRALGIPVETLGMPRGKVPPGALLRMARLLRQTRPDVVQTWMYHADLLGGLAARLAGVRRVVWGVHHADLSPRWNSRSTILTAKACARLSHSVPRRIVIAAESARTVHAAIGYAQDKMVFIPNGIDTHRFQPDPAARAALRTQRGIPASAPLVVLPARFHPIKDQRTFLQAAAITAGRVPEAQFVLCGQGISAENEELVSWISALGLGLYTHLLGPVSDMPRLLAACDVGCLSSLGEAFPLALVEMMACGLPCVATTAGDCPPIINDTGRLAAAGDSLMLADALTALLRLAPAERAALGARARARVEQNYSIERMMQSYLRIWDEVAAERA